MPESCLLTSELEKTNEAYALAKISGLKYCEFLNRQYGTDYISVMPTNLYGPNDNFHLENSHVMPAMMRKVYLAKLLVDAKMAQSAGEARRLIDGGGVKINQEALPAKSYNVEPELLKDATIQVGKRKFVKIV